ncbi:hypothetical protein ACJMK2_009197 [Sinanodonta woodiana]|uniref:Retinoblastoma-like protein 1 n=1 Tax=Sinanodonta woodiana TaxID=1069815 RepID=A0ABD3VBI1_SINWO
MGLSSEDGDEKVEQRYEELCLDLNMDKNAKEEAWNSYQRIRTNYTLEGDQIHWLSCALYEACRRSVVPTVGRGTVEGNCVSLTRLLRSAKFSLIQFFNKMKKWSDMANLSHEFRDKVDRLERNFAVSTVIFKKFQPIFLDIFRSPLDEPPRQPRSRKQRRLPCSVSEVFNFCWTMFVQVKGKFPAISDDLVNSYHLLLCNIDWFYANALLGGRKDLLNPDFSGLPENYHSRDWKPPAEPLCIMKHLCDKHEGLELEAKVIKEHWWKPHIRSLFDRKVLKGKLESLSAVLEIGNFEANSKVMNNAYEEFVLSVGDFDERIFLGEDADIEIGTPAKSRDDMAEELSEKMQSRSHLQQHFDQTRSLAPSTPLTGRRYLKEKDPSITPVSTATQSVSRLQHLLSGRKTAPSDTLLNILSVCGKNYHEAIITRVKEMGEVFCSQYAQATDSHPGSQMDFAKKRLQLGESLYFKTLESILVSEKARMMFPWIVEIFDLSPYHFYKVIEIVVREEEGLSRDVVKHLNHIEESILENFAWRSDSPLWDAIKEKNGEIPTSEEVTLPNHINPITGAGSPIRHPAVKRIAGEGRPSVVRKDPSSSPTGPSVADRFSSPSPGSAKRRLFDMPSAVSGVKPGQSLLAKQLNSGVSDTVVISENPVTSASAMPPTQIITYHQAIMGDGRQVLIPVQRSVVPPASTTESTTQTTPTDILQSSAQTTGGKATVQNKTKKTGSLALFFRKVYHLASVRLRDLCDRLDIDSEEMQTRMWTCLEHTLVHHVDLMMDRHIDQMVMCAIYVMAKVCDKSQSFQNIMKCYRMQPQAQSHVYRSVLLTQRKRRTSGSSDGSRNGTSGSSSPVTIQEETKEKKIVPIRSSSTLPIPHPSSHPPTPTRLVGTGSTFDFGEERGDLIKFYNQVYINKLKKFALKFSSQNLSGDAPLLSPLPPIRSHNTSPRRLSSKYSIFISPHKTSGSIPNSPHGKNGLSYSFNKSPAKNLRAINNMIRMGDKTRFAGKRLLQIDGDEESGESPPKKASQPFFMQRLQSVNTERQMHETNSGIGRSNTAS